METLLKKLEQDYGWSFYDENGKLHLSEMQEHLIKDVMDCISPVPVTKERIINLMESGSHPAPEEWKRIPEIKKQKPTPIGQEFSLQVIDGTNVCAWYINKGDARWILNSDFFIVNSELSPVQSSEKRLTDEDIESWAEKASMVEDEDDQSLMRLDNYSFEDRIEGAKFARDFYETKQVKK
jgi:hypothetical protein